MKSSAYNTIAEQRIAPSNLFAAEPEARAVTEQPIRDAGYDPVFVGDLAPGARLREDSSGLTRALAAELGPFYYRYSKPGDL